MVFLNFQKAFDMVPHSRLLHKLASYAFSNQSLQWLNNFLCFRHQKVVVADDKLSDWYDVANGDPQGSILGPLLLFNMLMTFRNIYIHVC